MPVEECESTLTAILEDLSPDPWLIPGDERPYRCTGNALSIALALVEASYPGQGAKIMTFIGGPCTIGPGQVVGIKLQEVIRSWIDIQKDNEIAKHVKKATKYYQFLTERAIKAHSSIDVFAFTVDQFGLLEMKSMAEMTGGLNVTNEMFNSQVFKDTFRKIFDKDPQGDLKFGFCGDVTLHMSKELRISGALGPCTSLKKATTQHSEEVVGQHGTIQWYLGNLDRNSTVAFYFDLPGGDDKVAQSKGAYIQFTTKYRHSNGRYRLRVTTVTRRFADASNVFDLVPGFDQEASCVLVSRLAVHKTEKEDPIEVIRWLDRSLIRVGAKFGDYQKENTNNFKLPKEFSLYPQFMYHLRRSNFVQTFAASPDESAFFRGQLSRENTTNCLVMIQPSLLQYSFESPEPNPVMLDIASMKNNVILLLDTYFDIVVWQGDMIKKWEKAGYHNQPEYENFKYLLQAPLDDSKVDKKLF